MMCHVTGRARILWPQTTFYDITVDDDTHIYAQIAPEPNYRWLDYCRESLHIAEEFEIDKIITLGSMFADCPHTRPLPLDVSDRGCQCDMDREYNGPVGLTTVLDSSAAEQGFDTSSLWVSVPQYLGSDECAQGTLQMLDSLSCVLGVDLDRGDLQKRAAVWRSQAEVLTRCNDDLADYVARLEREYDLKVNAKKVGDFGTPQAEQLVQETEAFLKNIDG
jgi:proteasome assembly chaperone (PAC2) family protein